MKQIENEFTDDNRNVLLFENSASFNLIHDVNRLAIRETDSLQYLRQICNLLVEKHGCSDAWGLLLDRSGQKAVCAESDAGESRFQKTDRFGRDDLPGCARAALDERNVVCIAEPASSCNECSLSVRCAGDASYCVCLSHGENLHGVLSISVPSSNLNLDNVQGLLKALASNVAMVIHTTEIEVARIQAEMTRKRSEQRLDLALKGANLGLWDWNLQTGEVVFDERWATILGFTCDGDEPNIGSWESVIHTDDMSQVDAVLSDHFLGKTAFYESEHRVRAKSGNWKWVLDRGRIVERAPDGTPLRATGTILDITLRKKTEEERERLAEQLRQSQKIESIGRLAGGIAHDLNNLLSPIIGYSEMALMDLHPEEALHGDMAEIREAAERAKTLTQQLLAFGRKQVLTMQSLFINDVINKSKKMMRRLIREDIEMRFRLDSAPGKTKADSFQIQQILMNLALNASDSMPSGGRMMIETRNVLLDEEYVTSHPVVETGHYVLLSVSDTGIGMDQETLNQIFEPFFTTKEIGRGTGLGLATVYGIVKQHGGYIWAYSEPGLGTTFNIYLPRIETDSSSTDISSNHPAVAQNAETILVVEDEDAVRKLTCRILEKQGYDVLEARTTGEAIRIAENEESFIHLLLTDIVMPGLNGRELYERVASFLPDTKVLYMSGYSDDVVAYHGILDSGVHFLQKPFSVENLVKTIRKTLDE
ncbi:MAG: response regulator [Deltaproteobacteria bacterium]|nr:response regulator [Deltaproteobacteria bacterium]